MRNVAVTLFFVMLSTLAIVGMVCGILGLATAVAAHNRAIRAVDDCMELLSRYTPAEGAVDPRAIRDVAVHRYDALTEMTGQLSFSIALLNSAADGIVLTSINGRTETRTYVKTVKGGQGVQPLSPEEERAVREARLGQGPPVLIEQSSDAQPEPA